MSVISTRSAAARSCVSATGRSGAGAWKAVPHAASAQTSQRRAMLSGVFKLKLASRCCVRAARVTSRCPVNSTRAPRTSLAQETAALTPGPARKESAPMRPRDRRPLRVDWRGPLRRATSDRPTPGEITSTETSTRVRRRRRRAATITYGQRQHNKRGVGITCGSALVARDARVERPPVRAVDAG